MDKTEVAAATALILEKAESDVVAKTAHSQAALADFLLAAQVDVNSPRKGIMSRSMPKRVRLP